MSVEIWYGRWPETEAEQNALLELYRFLQPQDQHYLVMVQFHPGKSNEIDWVIIKSNGIFLVELKHASDSLVGGTEGEWKIVCPDGSEIKLYSNPIKQVKKAYWQFTDWCMANQEKISAGISRSWMPDYKRGARSFIVITPDLHPNSKVEVPHPIHITGLSKFLLMLMMHSSSKLELSAEELNRFPQLLQLKKWEIVQASNKADIEPTRRLSLQWMSPPFTGLIAVGHTASLPMLSLDQLNKETITIGRGPDNDLAIEDETVSRHHAQIVRQAGRFAVKDLDSTSGTYINFKGEPAEPERRLVQGQLNALRNHSLVRFGQTRFMFLENQ